MNLNDFFDVNPVYLEILDTLDTDDSGTSKCTKKALKDILTEFTDAYRDEPDGMVQVWLSVYRLGLLNGFADETSGRELRKLTPGRVSEIFGADDGRCVQEVLTALLAEHPQKPESKARTPKAAQPAAKWEPGDVYAVRLDGPEICARGLEGRYVLFYCIGDSASFARGKNVYMLLSRSCELPALRADMSESADFLPAVKPMKKGTAIFPVGQLLEDSNENNFVYRFVITKPYRKGMPGEPVFCGKCDVTTPGSETIPPSDMFHPILMWNMLDHEIAHQYDLCVNNWGILK